MREMSIRSELARIIAGKPKQPADPVTRGGKGNADKNPYARIGIDGKGDRRQSIKRFMKNYKRGGPYADMVDAYHLFALAPGYEFKCKKEDKALKDRVVAWCDQEHVDLDFIMQQGILSAKLAGDAYQEIIPTKDGKDIWGVITRDPSMFDKEVDDYDRVQSYTQYIPRSGGYGEEPIPIEGDWIINLMIDCIPGSVYGQSIWDRAEDNINQDCDIVESVTKAMHRHGTPKTAWQLGSEENRASDSDIKTFRKEVEEMNAKTDFVVTHDTKPVPMDTAGINNVDVYSNVSLQRTACSLGVPEEMAGLGRGSTEACYSADTQTLTENGWKYYWEIDPCEKIAAFNELTGTIQYEIPIGFYVFDHNGPMYHFLNTQQDILVTPEHRMYLISHHSRFNHPEPRLRMCPAKAIIYPRFAFQAAINQYDGGHNIGYSDDEIKFIGYFLSEGSASVNVPGNRITLSQKKPESAKVMSEVLTRLGFKEKYSESKGFWWELYHAGLFNYLITECGGPQPTRCIPEEFKRLPPEKLQILLDALILGDGTIDTREGRTHMEYSTTSPQLADDVQEIAFKLGYRTKLKKQVDPRPNRRPLYRVSLNKSGKWADIEQADITQEEYTGQVYCFEVSTHIFITRRNGKIAIQGNTATVRMDTFLKRITALQQVVARTYSRCLIDRITGQPGKVWIEFNSVKPEDWVKIAEGIARLRSGVDPDAVIDENEAREKIGFPPRETTKEPQVSPEE